MEECTRTDHEGLGVGGPRDGVINVHIVPHTHDDVGWLKTVEEYYQGDASEVQIAAVRPILDTVIASLLENPARKFIYVEMAFFNRWWVDQSDETKANVKQLVEEGRLQFANGGWASNDEATASFVDIVDQHSLGTSLIVNLFGSEYVPRVGWQMDPFGHSHFQASAYSKMGMDSWFLGRIDMQDFAFRQYNHTLETIHSSILTGITEMYQAPTGFHWGYANPSENPEIDARNGPDRANAFVELCMRKKAMYNFDHETTSHVMFTFGDDFEYSDADRWFRNIDKLICYLNKDGRVNAFYSTPQIYTESRFKQRTDPWVTEKGVSDWFPYGDGEAVYDSESKKIRVTKSHSVWTGYFTSRPLLKKLIRKSSAILELCRIAEMYRGPSQDTSVDTTPSTALWKALSVVQHHDGVSGTAKHRVVIDYERQLNEGIEGCKHFIKNSGIIADVTGSSHEKFYWSYLASSRGRQSDQRRVGTHVSSIDAFFAFYRGATGSGRERPDQASGTYIFRPDCPEGSVTACVPTRAGSSDFPFQIKVLADRIEWSVGPLPVPEDLRGYEVVLVINASSIIKHTGGIFFTDSNGFNWIKRQINVRNPGGYDVTITDPVSANFYPIVGGIAITDNENALMVTPDRSVGGTSLRDGQIEIMVHRRLFVDDAKGMNEPLDEVDESGNGIVVSGTTYFEILPMKKEAGSTPPRPPNRDYIRPPIDLGQIVPGDNSEEGGKRLVWSPINHGALPESIVVTHMYRLHVDEFSKISEINDCWLVRVMHDQTDVSLAGMDNVVVVDWHRVLSRPIKSGKEVTLNTGRLIDRVKKLQWNEEKRDVEPSLDVDTLISTLKPGDFRTYVFEIARNHGTTRIVPRDRDRSIIVAES